jgi:hypothetical protein
MIFTDSIYKKFTASTLWDNMSKADRRKNTQKAFTAKIEKNIFLREHYKGRDTYFNGIQQKKAYITGFRLPLIIDEILENEFIDDDDSTLTL